MGAEDYMGLMLGILLEVRNPYFLPSLSHVLVGKTWSHVRNHKGFMMGQEKIWNDLAQCGGIQGSLKMPHLRMMNRAG